MGRMNKQQKAALTKKLNNLNSPTIKKWNLQALREWFPKHKLEIIEHKAKKKVIGGAKDAGKTYLGAMLSLAYLEENKNSYTMAARKYKTQAADKFHTIFDNAVLELRMQGFHFPDYKKSLTRTIRQTDFRNQQRNQSIEYVGFDDPNGIAGAEAPNLGKYDIILIDEPVMIDDPGKVPTRKEWRASLKVVRDTVDRSNRRHSQVFGVEVEGPTYFIMMNLWDDNHPEVDDLNRHITEEEFLEFIVGYKNILNRPAEFIEKNWNKIWQSIKENHTKNVYNEATDTLYTKMTKLSNPTIWKTADDKLQQPIKDALLRQDNLELARLLGMTYEGSTNIQKTYDLRKLLVDDTLKKFKEEKWKAIGYSRGWDIDINVALWGTVAILAEKDHPDQINHPFEKIEHLFIVPQDKINAFGVGGIGENRTKTYRDAMVNRTIEKWREHKNNFIISRTHYGEYCFIDDNFQTWIDDMYEPLAKNFTTSIGRARKHKTKNKLTSWDIDTRIANLQLMIDRGFVTIDEQNKELLRDLKLSTRKPNGEGRDESSWRNKIYNTINSLEYAVYPFRNRVLFIEK